MTLSIPQHRDPVARAALVACALALAWLAVTSALPAATAKEQPQVVILVATPTLPSATLAPLLSAPTAQVPTEAPPQPTEAHVVVEAPPVVVVEPAPTEPPASEAKPVGERGSDKAGPGERKGPPVVRGH